MPDVSVPNYGLLSGLANGLKEGLLSYQTTKNIQNQQQMQALATGYQRNPDTGALEPTQAKQEEMQAAHLKNQATIGSFDPNNPSAVRMAGIRNQFAQNAIPQDKWQKDEAGNPIAPTPYTGASEYEQEKTADLGKPSMSGGLLYQGNMAKADASRDVEQKKADLAAQQGDLNRKNAKEIAAGHDATGITKNTISAKAAADRASAAGETKLDAAAQKLATLANDPSSRSTLGRYQLNIDKGQTLKVLADQLGMAEGEHAPANETREQMIERFNKADPRQLYEFAKGADQLTSNAQSSIYGTDHMMPKDMDIASSKLREWMPTWAGGGRPADANAGEFIARYLDSANREGAYFQKAKTAAEDRLGGGGFANLKKARPEQYNQIFGRTEQPGLVNGQQPAAGPGGLLNNVHPQDAAALQWAKDNPNDPRAAAIIKANGM